VVSAPSGDPEGGGGFCCASAGVEIVNALTSKHALSDIFIILSLLHRPPGAGRDHEIAFRSRLIYMI
jgi:hypothetical protein